MSVAVKHLNADTTFLLTFSPDPSLRHPPGPENPSPFPTFTILIDPWLAGSSIIGYGWFVNAKHTVPACIAHLSEVNEPDLVLVSQSQTDHCHEATLRQLNPDAKTKIVAEPRAARIIRKYHHFHPARVISIPEYHSRQPASVLRFPIPALTPSGEPGELTITLIPSKKKMPALHNAIGITYQAPTAAPCFAAVSTVDLPLIHKRRAPEIQGRDARTVPESGEKGSILDQPVTVSSSYLSLPPLVSPIPGSTLTLESPRSPLRRSRIPPFLNLPPSPPDSPVSTSPTLFSPSSSPSSPMSFTTITTAIASPTPTSPARFITKHHPDTATVATDITDTTLPTSFFPPVTSAPISYPPRPRPISILYTPHGAMSNPLIHTYATNHLVSTSALPLTLLLHSFDRVRNPWYLGGNISEGAAGPTGGIALAKKLMARCWVGAHDEEKAATGAGVQLLRTDKAEVGEVRRALRGHRDGKAGWKCDVRTLGVGEEMVLNGL